MNQSNEKNEILSKILTAEEQSIWKHLMRERLEGEESS